ncbi:phosphate ABC transporter, permease protein PstA [Pseudohongiella acticola]|jgi:phosphate transport system permease protein|uniref:Phosphate transport system permease protein PstA n=1 Tax=Pseudohongiella acticola TaxID=1524254 RepID=A0A1E8CGV6_9GAMM|nr:phosphate ABC transporter permease PstA [Pseudohongiella acticola]OFE11609.1 phosphate ABC transporter, permease protein PstA [Pseudohongiella acticola]
MRQWFKSGTPWIWLNGGAVAMCMIMVIGLIGLIAVRGFSHFWPSDVAVIDISRAEGEQSSIMGELVRSESVSAAVARDSGESVPDDIELLTRHLFKLGNRDQTGRDFVWFLELGMSPWQYPDDAFVIERREWGNFYGQPQALLRDGEIIAMPDDADFWSELQASVDRSLELFREIRRLERGEIGRINTGIERLRLDERNLELNPPPADVEAQERARIEAAAAQFDADYAVLRTELDAIYQSTRRDTLRMQTADGTEVDITLATIVRVTAPNAMSVFAKMIQYVERLWEFMSDEPREANTEGGIFPAIFGTVIMVMVMSIIVTPFGILAAIYLREYARQGTMTRIIRISVYNLAGVPSIVYGVFGLGFFVYFLGGNIDELFYQASLPAPTFGTPGLFWASLTLALLTLPIVIVSTEEGLARIPSTIRQGSLALGATKSETLWKVIVPLATPAMMTGLILAIARAAGEVAPLMLVGVVKLAPTLPVDGTFPYIHLERKIMHLGFHIYDVGFQSPNVEAARPLVYATALVLVMLIVILNLTAISIRNHLRERYRSAGD